MGKMALTLTDSRSSRFLKHIDGSGHGARLFDSDGIGWNMHFERDWYNRQIYLAHTDGLALILETYNIRPTQDHRGLLIFYKQCDKHFQAQAHRHVRVQKISRVLPRHVQGFKACTRKMLSHYDTDFLAQLLWQSKKSNERERIDTGKEYDKEFLN